ncbi:MAG: kinase/pyrophosphorylase [bacterium]|nr:kinase/pyrophosphorylase [bacterium]
MRSVLCGGDGMGRGGGPFPARVTEARRAGHGFDTPAPPVYARPARPPDSRRRALKTIFVVSDGTGGTARRALDAALTQFPAAETDIRVRSDLHDAARVADVVREAAASRAVIVHTLVSHELRAELLRAGRSHVPTLDLMGPLLERLSLELAASPAELPGLFRQLNEDYFPAHRGDGLRHPPRRRPASRSSAGRHRPGRRLAHLQDAAERLPGDQGAGWRPTCPWSWTCRRRRAARGPARAGRRAQDRAPPPGRPAAGACRTPRLRLRRLRRPAPRPPRDGLRADALCPQPRMGRRGRHRQADRGDLQRDPRPARPPGLTGKAPPRPGPGRRLLHALRWIVPTRPYGVTGPLVVTSPPSFRW